MTTTKSFRISEYSVLNIGEVTDGTVTVEFNRQRVSKTGEVYASRHYIVGKMSADEADKLTLLITLGMRDKDLQAYEVQNWLIGGQYEKDGEVRFIEPKVSFNLILEADI